MAGFEKRRNLVTGGGSYSVLNLSKVKGRHEFFKLVAGSNKFDILPMKITSPKHPLVVKEKLSVGDLDFCLDIYVHRGIGPNEKTYVCPRRYNNSPCPICEASDAFKEAGNESASSALWPSRRLFYNIVDCMDREKGVQIFETNAKYFGKPLDAAQDDFDKDADSQEAAPNAFFPDSKNGLTIKVIGTEESYNGNKYIQSSSVMLLPRKESITEFLDDVVSFDTCFDVLSYEELDAIYTGAPTSDADEPHTEKVARRQLDEDEDELRISKVKEEEPRIEKAYVNKCPHGFEWHVDNDEHTECSTCPNKTYNACARG